MFTITPPLTKPIVVVLTYACTSGILRAQAGPDAAGGIPVSPDAAAGLLIAASPEEQRQEDAFQEILSTPRDEPEVTAQLSEVPFPPPVEAPTGFKPRPFTVLPGQLLQGFQWGLGISSVYESNLGRSGQPASQDILGGSHPGNNDKDNDDFIFSFSPRIDWKSESARWMVSAGAGLQYSEYLKNGELGGLGYDGHLELGYEGASGRIAGSFNYVLERGGNRYYGTFIEEAQLGAGLKGSWKISSKTSLDANFSFQWSDPSNADTETDQNSTDQFNSTENYAARLAAMWKASPLLRVGPGISYTRTGGDNYDGREALGPIIQFDYRLATKLSLNGNVGWEYTLNQGAGTVSDSFPTVSLSLNYQASFFWSANASVSRSVQANGSEADTYRETTAWRLGLTRKILRAQLGMGASYETGDVTSSSSSNREKDSLENLTVDASLSMPLTKRIQGSLFANWRDEGGYRSSGNGYSAGLSLSLSF